MTLYHFWWKNVVLELKTGFPAFGRSYVSINGSVTDEIYSQFTDGCVGYDALKFRTAKVYLVIVRTDIWPLFDCAV